MEIERFDERTAAFYEWLVSLRVFDWAYSAAAKAVAKVAKPGGRVLEVGPGTGALMRGLEAAGYRVVGIDVSPPMLKYAKRRGAGDPLAGASFAQPLRGAAFDAAVALFTLHHWGPHGPSAAEVKRVLKPGAYFVAIEVDKARMPLVGSHGCTKRCLEEVLSDFDVVVERRFLLLVAYAKAR